MIRWNSDRGYEFIRILLAVESQQYSSHGVGELTNYYEY